jgi:hypothetical protein
MLTQASAIASATLSFHLLREHTTAQALYIQKNVYVPTKHTAACRQQQGDRITHALPLPSGWRIFISLLCAAWMRAGGAEAPTPSVRAASTLSISALNPPLS